MQTRRQRLLLTLCLFLYFFLRLFPAGYFKDFWDDETVGLGIAYSRSWITLLITGSGEANPAPLYYMIDKLWHEAWGNFPHAYWDLRIFNRIPHIFYWSAASAITYLFLERFFKHFTRKSSWKSTVSAVATTLFLHSNTFAIAYSVEDRGYSLWVSLTTIQLLLFLDGILLGFNTKKISAIAVVSFFLAFGAFSSIGLTTCILFYFLFEIFRRRNMAFNAKALVYFIPAYCVGMWYFSRAPQMSFSNNYFHYLYFLDTIQSVLAKTFRLKAAWAVWVSLPIFFLLPSFAFKENFFAQWVRLYAGWALVCACIFFLGSYLKGGIWAHRYLIFLVPYFTALYWLNLLSVFKLAIRFFKKKIPHYSEEQIFTTLILVWSIFTSIQSLSRQIPIAIHDWRIVNENNFFRKAENNACKKDIVSFSGVAYNTANQQCRTFEYALPSMEIVN